MKKKILKPILAVCVAFLFVAVSVLCGCATSEDWVRDTIIRCYYSADGNCPSAEELNGLSIEEMIAKLDIYSAYYTPRQYGSKLSENAGNKKGLGVSWQFEEGKGVVVLKVTGNSPAYKAGVRAGEVFTGGNGVDGYMKFSKKSDFTDFLTANPDNGFVLYSSGGDEYELAQEGYTASYTCMYTADNFYDVVYDGTFRKIIKKEGGIAALPRGAAYIYLSQFYGGAPDEIGELIKIFNEEGCTSLILDLRGNGGGFVDYMCDIAGRFTSPVSENCVAMYEEYKDGSRAAERCVYHAENVVPAGTGVYVMADDDTASASESLVGVLLSYDILKCENIFLTKYGDNEAKSYGKGIMQTTYTNFVTGEALKLTTAGVYWANGVIIHGIGLLAEDKVEDPRYPDGCTAAVSTDGIPQVGEDEELYAVIDKIEADMRASV